MRLRQAVSSVLAASVFAFAGCGGGNLAEITGTVKYEGNELEKGSITFIPVDGNGPTEGGLITNGRYSVKNVPVGTAKVVITASRVVGKVDKYGPGGPQRDKSESYLPDKYSNRDNTELRYEVTSGKHEKDFNLDSK